MTAHVVTARKKLQRLIKKHEDKQAPRQHTMVWPAKKDQLHSFYLHVNSLRQFKGLQFIPLKRHPSVWRNMKTSYQDTLKTNT